MSEHPSAPPAAAPRPRYIWPWFVLAGVVLGIVLAILWMSHEVQRTRRLRELNASFPAATNSTTAAPAKP